MATERTGSHPKIKVVINGYPQEHTPSAFVNRKMGFAGVLRLTTPFGTFWDDYIQVGALTITTSGQAEIGGVDRIKITSNGSAITLPSTFTNVGTDSISTSVGAQNILYVVKTGDNAYDYTVKVI